MEKIAEMITGTLVKEKIISKDEIEIYQYGAELLISTGVNLLLGLLLGGLFHSIISGVIYFMVLATLRTQAGGYHASTYLWCGTVYCISFLGVMGFVRLFIYMNINSVCLMLGLLINMIFIWWHAPVLHRRSMEDEARKHVKRRVAVIGIIWILIAIAIYYWSPQAGYTVLASIEVVLFYMILGKRLEEKENERENENEFTKEYGKSDQKSSS